MSIFCSVCLASPSDESIDDILELSGVTSQVADYPGMIQAGFMQGAQQSGSISESDAANIIDSINRTVVPAAILGDIRASVKKSVSENDIEEIQKWYKSDLGQEITNAEKAASTPESIQQMMGSAQELMQDTKRLEFAKRLDQLLGATEMTLDLQRSTSIAVYTAMMSAVQPDQEPDIQAIEDQMTAMESQMRASIEQYVAVSFIYTYQSISEEKLAKYETFLGTDAARKFNDSLIEGLKVGLKQAVVDMMSEIAQFSKDTENKQS
ncbi:DUF2059 domain-containing protein [Hahella ganghwensis]|uniref:DUF2059 domain-containing protein n=1 Tax=Hahella ganghwensis TaxID=286420 RepID=UPI000378A112|nr:DUF2059 domain-containing protein [Hahella ganghwensis]